MNPINVTLAVSRGPEVYHGEPTGRTVYRAEAVGPALGSVLGRGDSAAEAMADWRRRAEADGHAIGAISQAVDKPARVLALATFCPGRTPEEIREIEQEWEAERRREREADAAFERAASRANDRHYGNA